MNLEQLGNLGELVGGLAVIVSVIYLATQIQQSNRWTKAAVHQATSDSYLSWVIAISSDAELAELWRRMLNDDAMNDAERNRIGLMIFAGFQMFQNIYAQARVDSSVEARYAASTRMITSNSTVRAWWARQKTFFEPGFIEQMDASMARADAEQRGQRVR